MAENNKPVSGTEIRLGGLSFFFLAIGIVGPFFGALGEQLVASVHSLSTADPAAIAFGLRIILLVVAFALGIFGRRTRAGRIAFISSGAVLAIGLIAVAFLFSRHAAKAVREPTQISVPKP